MSASRPLIGVLALQGAVQPHKPHIEAAGGEFRPVKTPEDFEAVDAFILPGGESTTMLKLIDTFELWDTLKKEFEKKPVWGICAGAILIAEHVTNPEQKSFGLIPMTVQRNAYGRQLESHHGAVCDYNVSFIRAPVMSKLGRDVKVKAEHEGNPVWVQYGQYMATTFHPELTVDYPSPMHREFVSLVAA